MPEYNGGEGTPDACRQRSTSELILDSDAVWTLGDHAYPTATAEQFEAVYEPTWGRMKDVTFPTPGDHDIGKEVGLGPYTDYFGRPEYYSFDMGGWHVISLNSEIDHAAGSEQVKWLEQDLAATSANCIAAYWSKAMWTSGTKGLDHSFDPFWHMLTAAGADVVLSGDIHNYERFAKQTVTGDPAAAGIRQFVVGTGGRSLDGFPHVQPLSEARHKVFGVLQLTLEPDSYTWEFIDEARLVLDEGSEPCN